MLLLPLALLKGERWPRQRDWPAGIGLGLLFFVLLRCNNNDPRRKRPTTFSAERSTAKLTHVPFQSRTG